MTDKEAKVQAEMLLKATKPGGTMGAFLRHALVAMADRAALVESWKGFLAYEANLRSKKWLPIDDAMHAARNHMAGK